MKSIALVILLLLASNRVFAEQGDCGQPVSDGPQPIASDCLFILRAAVGSETCTPECICNPNAADGVTAIDALACLRKTVGPPVDLACTCGFEPLGEEMQVNSRTGGFQRKPSVAVDGDGNLIVAWESTASDGLDSDGTSIQARRFLSTGAPFGAQFEVNTWTTGTQSRVSLAAAPVGAFVMAWSHFGANPADTSSVRARLFDGSGAAVGDDFQVNSYTPSGQSLPSVGMDAAGNFVVVWQSYGSPGSDRSGFSIQGQRFDWSGSAIGTQFQINTYTTDAQTAPAIAMAPAGNFVVVWTSAPHAGPEADGDVKGQRFDESGVPVGTEFTVNASPAKAETADVAIHTNGSFVVVWTGIEDPGSDDARSIQARRFDGNGDPLGLEFQANGSTTQTDPSVASLTGGTFVVAWHDESYGSYGVSGQLFDAAGEAAGKEFRVSSASYDRQQSADVAPTPNGGFAVVWEGDGIRGQRFE
jgi:hypothetical protein